MQARPQGPASLLPAQASFEAEMLPRAAISTSSSPGPVNNEPRRRANGAEGRPALRHASDATCSILRRCSRCPPAAHGVPEGRRGPGPSSPPAPSGPSGSGTNYRAAPRPSAPEARPAGLPSGLRGGERNAAGNREPGRRAAGGRTAGCGSVRGSGFGRCHPTAACGTVAAGE